MVVAAIGMCKDEADICEVHLRHLAANVDFIITADNGSTDGTREILAELEGELPLTVLDDPEAGYYQSRKMTALAAMAAEQGADWVVPADYDEIWYARSGATLSEALGTVAPQWLCVAADMFDHYTTDLDDATETNPVKRMGWRMTSKGQLPKVACRVRPDLVIEQGNHSATYHGGATILEGPLVIRHFPYRGPEHFVRKAHNGRRAYLAAEDLDPKFGSHWKGYGAIAEQHGDDVLVDMVYRPWFHYGNPRDPGNGRPPLIFDPAPLRPG